MRLTLPLPDGRGFHEKACSCQPRLRFFFGAAVKLNADQREAGKCLVPFLPRKVL